jgi:predicted  nucleic acid-binding Zn-ribbon protein
MDRRYIIGFCIGILFVLILGSINSAYEDFQKQNQSKINTDRQVASLLDQIYQQNMRISSIGSDLQDLRRLVTSRETYLSSLESKFSDLQIKIDELK